MDKTNKILLKNLKMIENAFSWMLIKIIKKMAKKSLSVFKEPPPNTIKPKKKYFVNQCFIIFS